MPDSREGRPALRAIRRRRSQRGFIQTLELLILMAIFGTVIYFALELVNRWLIAFIDPMGGKNVVVYDANGTFITRTKSMVGNEAPLLVYRINGAEAALLGLRAETNGGFTTRQRLYFSGTTTCDPNDPDAYLWILDPTTAAGAATNYLPWDTTADPILSALPSPIYPYGHPISDFYSLQTIAFAMGPDGLLYRAYGSESSNPPLPVGYDPTIFGYPASEWDSQRYDATRCRQIGPDTTLPASANNEQTTLAAYLMQVDTAYTVNDKNGIPFAPNFWSPSRISSTPPPVVVDSEGPAFAPTPLDETSPAINSPHATFTDADGNVHTAPGPEDTPP